MALNGAPRRAGRLAMYVVGIVASLMLAACNVQNVSQTAGPVRATAMPTQTPTPLPAAQAWKNYSTTSIPFPLPTTSFFVPMDIAPDGSIVVGLNEPAGQMQVMLLEVASGKTRVLYTASPDLATPFHVMTDGRFVVWAGGNEGEGAHSQRNIVGFSDVQTGNVTLLADNNQYQHIVQFTHGTLVWYAASTTGDAHMVATDLATRTTTTLPFTLDWRCGSMTWPYHLASWPYLLCEQTNGMTSWGVYNLETHLPATPSTFGRLMQGASGSVMAVDGTTAFVLPAESRDSPQPAPLLEIDQITRVDANSQKVGAAFVAKAFGANGRIVIWDGTGNGRLADGLYAWDRAQHLLVALGNPQSANVTLLVVREHVVMILHGTGKDWGDITIINTDALPKAAAA